MDLGFDQARGWLGLVYASSGRYDEAIAEYNKVPYEHRTLWIGYIHGIAGRRDEAEKILHELEQLETTGRTSREAILWVGIGLGDKDRAFADLERAYQIRSVSLTSLKVHPCYDSLRSDARFADLLRRTNLAP